MTEVVVSVPMSLSCNAPPFAVRAGAWHRCIVFQDDDEENFLFGVTRSETMAAVPETSLLACKKE